MSRHTLEEFVQLGNKGLIALYCKDDKAQAREFFIKALRYNPEFAQAYNNLGMLDLEEKSYASAEKYFRRALEVNPDYAEARWNLARLLKLTDRPEEAEKQLRQLLAANPSIADAHELLGILRLEAGELEEAIAPLTRAPPARVHRRQGAAAGPRRRGLRRGARPPKDSRPPRRAARGARRHPVGPGPAPPRAPRPAARGAGRLHQRRQVLADARPDRQ